MQRNPLITIMDIILLCTVA